MFVKLLTRLSAQGHAGSVPCLLRVHTLLPVTGPRSWLLPWVGLRSTRAIADMVLVYSPWLNACAIGYRCDLVLVIVNLNFRV